MDKKKLLQEIKSYFFIFVGVGMYTFSTSAFLIPHKIVGGGATGLATIIFYLTNQTIPVAVSYLITNGLLLLLGLKILGPKFGIKTVYAIVMSTLLLGIFQPLLADGLVSDVFMSAIIAGIVNGIGVAITITYGGSTGGVDIIALIIAKFRNISPGKVMMYCDGTIITGSLLINFNIEGLMYGFVAMGVVAFTVDFVLAGQKQSAQLFIFTDNHEEVANQITQSFRRGVSIVDCLGWYTKQHKKMLIVVVRKNEALDILKIAKRVDPNAFMTMNTVMGVFGQGFEEVKGMGSEKKPKEIKS